MTVAEAIRNRYSCRSYLDKPVEQDKLDLIFEAVRLAPSAKNLQDWRLVVVTDPAKKNRLAVAANNQTFIEKAAAIIVACSISTEKMRCGQAVAPIDVAIALEHVCLQATELGLATCWIGSFYPDQVRPILEIPENVDIIELMALGYPADARKPPRREPVDRLISRDTWRF